MSLIQNIKRHLGLEPIEEKLQRFEEIRKAFAESDLQLDELAKDFFIEKSMYEARMKEPDNYIIQPKIQEKFDTFIKGHKESIRKAKKQFDSLKKEKDEIEKAFSNHKYIKKEPDGKGGWNYVYEDEKGKEVKAEMKPWIKERARKITNGYKNPFTGDISNEDEEYAHFVTFATKVSEANKYDSFDELLNNTLKKSLDDNIQSKEQTAYSKIKKAYQHGKISLDSFNTIIKGLTKEGKTKYADFLLFNEEGKLLLLKRSSWEDDNAGAWVIPGGHVDPGEDFKTAAIRELQEESGYNVEDAENVGSYEDEKCHIEYFQAYVNTSEKPLLLQFSEVRDYKWIPVNEICEEAMVFNMRDNVMKVLGIEDQNKNKKIIRKAILAGIIPAELIEKAKSGIYKPTAENKKLGRVGQKYGEKKEDVLSKVLNKVESEIVNLKYEHGYCFDERGNEIFNHTDHQVDGIDLTQFKDQLKNNIFTHNHPRNNAHSIHDIAVCLLGQIKEYRTVVLASDRGHGSYVFENKTDKTIDLSLYEEDVSNKYKEWFESIKDYRQVEEGWIEVFRMTEIYKENANNLQFYFQLVNGDKIKI